MPQKDSCSMCEGRAWRVISLEYALNPALSSKKQLVASQPVLHRVDLVLNFDKGPVFKVLHVCGNGLKKYTIDVRNQKVVEECPRENMGFLFNALVQENPGAGYRILSL